MGIGFIQQYRQNQHLQCKTCLVGADDLIGPKPYGMYNVPTFRVDLGIDPYKMGISSVC